MPPRLRDGEDDDGKIYENPESEEGLVRQRSQFQRDGINMIKGNMSSLMVRESIHLLHNNSQMIGIASL